MSLTAERLCAFAARARNILQHGDVTSRRVVALRLRNHITIRNPYGRYMTTGASGAVRLEGYAVPIDDHALNAHQFLDEPTKATASSRGPFLQQPLPVTCSGCGALSQETAVDEAGYYSRSRKAVKTYLKRMSDRKLGEKLNAEISEETSTPDESITRTGTEEKPVYDVSAIEEEKENLQLSPTAPVCDRCHDLIYNAKGQSIAHPSVEDLADSIAESPFNRNHVYHVLDAADFPMSLIPSIFKKLELAKPRSQNRRSRHKFTNKPSVSFIVTRSDLLGPTKDIVDKMMPYFQSVLRTALGRSGRDIRLGNVHLVSAKRGWWCKDIKDSIWDRGGGNWMVGRVNVGKSNLFEVLFPKGSGDRAPVYTELKQEQEGTKLARDARSDQDFLAEDSLLPPAQPEVPFPAMPIVSSLPGTTASPIRLPFGNHRGELVDLPGLERGNLEEHIRSEHKLDLVMQHRPKVEQQIIKPGQSLLIGGGLIRITPQLDPNDPSTTMLAYAFVPVDAHVTATEKAIGSQQQERESGIKSILAEGVGKNMRSAGMLGLTTDVTKVQAGPLLRAGVPVSNLPFRVYSTDILIEGVGWVELVCQVRRRRRRADDNTTFAHPKTVESTTINAPMAEDPPTEPTFLPFSSQTAADGSTTAVLGSNSPVEETSGPDFPIPQVEIFSPNGKHVAQRKPLGAWTLWDDGRKRRAREAAAKRPRRSMKGVKKQMKTERRRDKST